MGYVASFISFIVIFLCSSSPLLLHSHKFPVPIYLLSLTTVSFDEGYTQLFGDSNLMLLRDGKTVHISLDERTGAGFAAQDLYLHGFFSASIKLPSDYAAGSSSPSICPMETCSRRTMLSWILSSCGTSEEGNGEFRPTPMEMVALDLEERRDMDSVRRC